MKKGKKKQTENELRAIKRNSAKGMITYFLRGIKTINEESLYPEEISALKLMTDLGQDILEDWKKPIPASL